MSDARSRTLIRRRVALASLVAALAGGASYVADRAYFHAMSGGGVPAIVLREARIGYLLALMIACFVAGLAGLLSMELVRSEAQMAAMERVLEKAALPVLFLVGVGTFLFP